MKLKSIKSINIISDKDKEQEKVQLLILIKEGDEIGKYTTTRQREMARSNL